MLVARCASVNGSRAAKCGYAHASRKWFTSFTLREDSRAPTSLRSPTSNTHSLPRASLREGDCCVIPTVCRRHPVQIFLLSISLEQAQIRLFVKIFAERGGFEPPKPFWSLHAFQACLFNHSSISPSSQLACKKKLACEFGLPPLLLLNRTHEVRFIFYSVHDRHKFSMNIFGIGADAFSFAKRHNTPNDPQRYKKYLTYTQ